VSSVICPFTSTRHPDGAMNVLPATVVRGVSAERTSPVVWAGGADVADC
jgi:hypothetical protein